LSNNPTNQALETIRDRFEFAMRWLASNFMSDIKSAYRAGSDAVSGASRRKQLMLLLLPGVGVAVLNFVRAYHARSVSGALIAGIVWLVIYPILAIRYSPPLFHRRPKS